MGSFLRLNMQAGSKNGKEYLMRKISSRNGRLKYPRICMITVPLPASLTSADVAHVSSLLRLLEPLGEKIFVITGNFPENIFNNNKFEIKNVEHHSNSRFMFIRIPKFIIMQPKCSRQEL